MKLRKPKDHKPAKPRDTGTCLRATMRRQARSEARRAQSGPNPTPGPNRAFRRTWQPVTGSNGKTLVRVRRGKLEGRRAA